MSEISIEDIFRWLTTHDWWWMLAAVLTIGRVVQKRFQRYMAANPGVVARPPDLPPLEALSAPPPRPEPAVAAEAPPLADPVPVAAAPRRAAHRFATGSWRDAIVTMEVLAPPLALRGPVDLLRR